MYERMRQNITDEEFLLIIEYELTQQYNLLYIVSDRMEFINKVKEKYKSEYKILAYKTDNKPSDNQRYKDIALTIEKIKTTKGSYDIMKLEDEIKKK